MRPVFPENGPNGHVSHRDNISPDASVRKLDRWRLAEVGLERIKLRRTDHYRTRRQSPIGLHYNTVETMSFPVYEVNHPLLARGKEDIASGYTNCSAVELMND
jgi:hypothetical protein